MEISAPTAWLVIRRSVDGHPDEAFIYEGELPVSQNHQYPAAQAQQPAPPQDPLKSILGDGQAAVTVSKDISHKDYGQGGSVFVSVRLTCDQSVPIIEYAVKHATYFVDKNLEEQYAQLQIQLSRLGVTA